MSKNITLLGADYPDVPAVVLPKTGGGSAMFVDADDVNNVENALAIVIDGNNAPKAITAGQYLFIKNHSTLATGGYHATANIASGGAVSSSNVSADADGIANEINNQMVSQLRTQVADLNTPLANGCDIPTMSMYLANAANKPTGNSGFIFTWGAGRYRQQIAFELTGEIYSRYYDSSNSSYTSWVKRST